MSVEFVLIEREDKMPKQTSVKYYLAYGRTIPEGNKKSYRPADLKEGMVIEGYYKQGVIIKQIKEHTDNKLTKIWTLYLDGQTAGQDIMELGEYQSVIVDKVATDLVRYDKKFDSK